MLNFYRGRLAATLLTVALFAPSAAHADDPPCLAPAKWFPNTPPPANAKPNPNLDCDFYSWAWETFLYITQEEHAGSGPRFLRYTTPVQLFGHDADARFPETATKLLILAPRFGEVKFPQTNDVFRQASTNGVLVDQNGHAVFYATHMNADFVKFVKDNQLTNLQKLHDAPADLKFPKGSLELKSSWKIVQKGEDTTKFFTTQAVIPLLKLAADGKTIEVDTKTTQPQTVALLGLHVVGVVDGHPEFIWATFEHDDNAPNLPDKVNPTDAVPVDPDHGFTLYPKGALASDSNQNNRKTLAFADVARQLLQPKTSVFRQFKFGGEDQPQPIIELNATVHVLLPKRLAVWKNYSFRGAVWINNPATDFKPDMNFGTINDGITDDSKKILGGEAKLSNTTMETFSQATQNCFHCHTSEALPDGSLGPKLFNVSHILTDAFVNGQPPASATPKTNNGK
jgi:hypothetical protein